VLRGDVGGVHLDHQQRGEGQGDLPGTPSGDLHRLQMHREICSKIVICGTGGLPESPKKIKQFQVQLEPESIKDQQGEMSNFGAFAGSAPGLEMLEGGRKKCLFCCGKWRKGREHIRSLLQFGQGLATARRLQKV